MRCLDSRLTLSAAAAVGGGALHSQHNVAHLLLAHLVQQGDPRCLARSGRHLCTAEHGFLQCTIRLSRETISLDLEIASCVHQ